MMKREDVKKGMEVYVVPFDYIGHVGHIFVNDMVLVVGTNNCVKVPISSIARVKNTDYIQKGGTTMNEKEASKHACDTEGMQEQINKLQRTVNVLQKDLDKVHEQLRERHDPIPELTDLECHVLELLSEDYDWVAKDADGGVCVFADKPTYDEDFEKWECEDEDDYKIISKMNVMEFENLPTSQPFKIVDLIKEG